MWNFVATILNEACSVFVNVENMMKQLRLPLTMHVCRMVWRNLIIFAHNIVIILILMIWGDITFSWELCLLPLSTLLYCWNALNIGLLMGIVCTRYRDIGPLVANFVQLLFFITPIMWNPQILTGKSGELAWIANYNPLYHFIEIFRAPLLGRPFPPYSWIIVLTATAILWILAIWVMTKFRHRVTYWL
jgi:lipopolysaccharide transport system permease protein